MGTRIEELTPARADLLAPLAALRAVTDAECNPGDTPIGVDELGADLFEGRAGHRFRTFVAFDDAGADGPIAIGVLQLDLDDDADNAHIVGAEDFAVHPDRRRAGVARALLRAGLAAVADEARTSLLLFVPELHGSGGAGAGDQFAAALGLTLRTEERCSRVAVTDIPDDLVDGWVAQGRARDDGYRIVQFSERCPDEHLAAYLTATASMEDMPVDDLDWVVAPVDESVVRERERIWALQGFVPSRTLALDADGAGAAISELFMNRHRPRVGLQGDTGVLAAHRGRGLGRWLKAENLRLAQQRNPAMETVETWNAQSNPWMLDINVAMGFRPHLIWRGYQGDVAEAVTRLG